MVFLRRVDKKRFKEVTFVYLDFLYNVALKYSGSTYDAEDLVQETMYTAYRKFYQLRDEEKCKSWLFAILRSHFFKEKRQFAKRPILDDGTGYLKYIPDKTIEGIVDLLEKKVTRENLHRVLTKLPEKHKEVLIFHYMEDMTYQEIAEYLEIPIGTVMSRLARGKQSLKKGLLRDANSRKRRGKIIQLMGLLP